MRPLHWGPVRPYQPPAGAEIRRVRLTAEEYRERKAAYPEALEDCHFDDDGYYRRLCYNDMGWVEAQGPRGDFSIYDPDGLDELVSECLGKKDFWFWPL